MNSGCAVFASDAAGSTSYLINDSQNGFCYKSGDIDELYSKVKQVLDNDDLRKTISKNAYETMKNCWDADVAAERFLKLAEAINDRKDLNLYEDGPCSRA
jgi:glycosyltransferase involved in cell wall biosynthesis